jgi:hypothetical protein
VGKPYGSLFFCKYFPLVHDEAWELCCLSGIKKLRQGNLKDACYLKSHGGGDFFRLKAGQGGNASGKIIRKAETCSDRS